MAVKQLLIVLTTFIGLHLVGATINKVPDNCISEPHEKFNLNCSNEDGIRVVIFPIGSELWIKCKNQTEIRLKPYPSLNETFDTINIENCTLPVGASFGALFKDFDIKDGMHRFAARNSVDNLTGRFSSGFEQVESLSLSNNKIKFLDKLVFQNMPNLTELMLQQNEIANLPENVFQSLTKLKKLNLSGNRIGKLPAKVFQSLTKLNKLNLSGNRIGKLSENVFQSLANLLFLDLSSTRLRSLDDGMFRSQTNLTELRLNDNFLEVITEQKFQGLDSLTVLHLEENQYKNSLTDRALQYSNSSRLKEIRFGINQVGTHIEMPYNIFANHSNLREVFLRKVIIANGLHLSNLNRLRIELSDVAKMHGLSNISMISITKCEKLDPLAVDSFQNLSGITELELSSNRLTVLIDGLFGNLTSLERLNLSNNAFTNISGLIFRDLHTLIEIDLSGNRLVTIDPDAFANNQRLETVKLQRNHLSFSDNRLPFLHLTKLTNLNLSNNNLTRMPSELFKMKKLTLDLGSNNISLLKYSDLREANIDFTTKLATNLAPIGSVHTYLKNNPLMCDCSMYKFFLEKNRTDLANVFGQNCVKNAYSLEFCNSEVNSSGKCPAECRCTKIDQYLGIQISCESKGLDIVPEINEENGTAIVLNVKNNSLTKLPKLRKNSSVFVIQASNNQILTIELENLPLRLRVLDVTHNRIQKISADVLLHIQMHKSLEAIFLAENQFICDCSDDTTVLIAFAKNLKTDLQTAKCTGSPNDYCSDDCITASKDSCTQRAYFVGFAAFIVLAMLGTSGVLYYKHEKFIKAWLYAHNWCSWWVDEEYVDRELQYDAFLSYSQKDENFAHYLVDELENGIPRFQLCFHERDFVAGEEIHRSITNAVERSRRVIVILSENYLNSPWATTEFHLALRKSIAERRKRLIVVKHGEFKDDNIPDKSIRWYVTANTYIQWNHRWFWENIRYAMPHKNNVK